MDGKPVNPEPDWINPDQFEEFVYIYMTNSVWANRFKRWYKNVWNDAKQAKEEISHYKTKAECYGNIVHGCSPALEAAGFPVDSRMPDGAVGGIKKAVEALCSKLKQIQEENEDWKDENTRVIVERNDAEAKNLKLQAGHERLYHKFEEKCLETAQLQADLQRFIDYHETNCDIRDFSPEGIRKPCNCYRNRVKEQQGKIELLENIVAFAKHADNCPANPINQKGIVGQIVPECSCGLDLARAGMTTNLIFQQQEEIEKLLAMLSSDEMVKDSTAGKFVLRSLLQETIRWKNESAQLEWLAKILKDKLESVEKSLRAANEKCADLQLESEAYKRGVADGRVCEQQEHADVCPDPFLKIKLKALEKYAERQFYIAEDRQKLIDEMHSKLKDATNELTVIRPKHDAYVRVCQTLNIEHDILGYINKQIERITKRNALLREWVRDPLFVVKDWDDLIKRSKAMLEEA